MADTEEAKSPYVTDRCCGQLCAGEMMPDPNEPCWGKVTAVEEVESGDGDYVWIHSCEGHADVHEGGNYKPRPDHG